MNTDTDKSSSANAETSPGAVELDYNTLKTILDNSYDEIYVTDVHGRVLYVNNASERHYGAAPEEIIGKTPEEISGKRFWTPRISPIAMDKKQSITLEQKTCLGKTLLTTATPVYDDNGKICMVIENSRDITEADGIRHELQLSQQMLDKYKLEVEELRKRDQQMPDFIYKSKSMATVMALAARVAAINATILVLGESGTGKGILAKYIHQNSRQREGPFVSINCAAIPSELMESELFGYSSGSFTGASGKGKIGLFELANGGTLFLDEIAEIPLRLQAKLLHAFQEKVYYPVGGRKEKTVSCRIIAATNKDLSEMVARGEFRDDLYYRLNVFEIHIPPLRERVDDITPLVHHLLLRYNNRHGLHRQIGRRAFEYLLRYPWPGNVREMENTVERLVVMATEDLIDVSDLPEAIRYQSADLYAFDQTGTLDEAVENVERKIITDTYEKLGSSYAVARALKISQSKASRLIRRYCGANKQVTNDSTESRNHLKEDS